MEKVSRKSILQVTEAILSSFDIRRAIKYISPNLTVKATLQRKRGKRSRSTTMLVSIGSPNYAERKFIKLCKASGERFPIAAVQLKFYPSKF